LVGHDHAMDFELANTLGVVVLPVEVRLPVHKHVNSGTHKVKPVPARSILVQNCSDAVFTKNFFLAEAVVRK
jgi:hypothetical protein